MCTHVHVCKKKKKNYEKQKCHYLQAILCLGSGKLSLLNQRPEHCVVQIVYVTWETKNLGQFHEYIPVILVCGLGLHIDTHSQLASS